MKTIRKTCFFLWQRIQNMKIYENHAVRNFTFCELNSHFARPLLTNPNDNDNNERRCQKKVTF